MPGPRVYVEGTRHVVQGAAVVIHIDDIISSRGIQCSHRIRIRPLDLEPVVA